MISSDLSRLSRTRRLIFRCAAGSASPPPRSRGAPPGPVLACSGTVAPSAMTVMCRLLRSIGVRDHVTTRPPCRAPPQAHAAAGTAGRLAQALVDDVLLVPGRQPVAAVLLPR